MSDAPERLWTAADLAAFLGYTVSTITTLCSRSPERLPPRVANLSAPRWVPSVCQAWALRHSGEGKRKGGRPRL